MDSVIHRTKFTVCPCVTSLLSGSCLLIFLEGRQDILGSAISITFFSSLLYSNYSFPCLTLPYLCPAKLSSNQECQFTSNCIFLCVKTKHCVDPSIDTLQSSYFIKWSCYKISCKHAHAHDDRGRHQIYFSFDRHPYLYT